MSTPLALHERHEGADAIDDTPEVHVDHPPPRRERDLLDQSGGDDACIVVQDIDSAVVIDSLVAKAGDGLGG